MSKDMIINPDLIFLGNSMLTERNSYDKNYDGRKMLLLTELSLDNHLIIFNLHEARQLLHNMQ